MQIHKLGAAMSAGLLALALAACGGEEDDPTPTNTDTGAAEPEFDEGTKMAELFEAGAIRVGIKYDQPLFGEETLDGFEGFDVEIAKLLATKLGIPEDGIEFIESISANREPFLQNDQVDVVIATYTINETRDEVIDFAGPYYVAGQDILVPAGNPDSVEGPDDLVGLNVCSVEGSTPAGNIQENYPDVQLTLFGEYSLCLDALLNGQVDAITTDNVILSGYVVQNEGEVELVGAPFTQEPYGIGVPQTDDRVFCEWINDQLDGMYEDGTWAEAFEATVGTAGIETPAPPATGSCETPGAA